MPALAIRIALVLLLALVAGAVMNRLLGRWLQATGATPLPHPPEPGTPWPLRPPPDRLAPGAPAAAARRWRRLTPLVLGAAGLAAVAAAPEASWGTFGQALLLTYLLYPLAVMDAHTHTVDGRLVALGMALRLAWLAWARPALLVPMVAGLLMGAGLFALVDFFYRTFRGRTGLGEGDAAVLGLIGLFVGWQWVFPVVLLSAAAGLVVAVPWRLLRRAGWGAAVPFAPFLAAGGLAVYLLQVALGMPVVAPLMLP